MEDLRQGRLDITDHYERVDLPFYRQHIEGFLPPRIIDIHTHTTEMRFYRPDTPPPTFWADRVCRAMPLPNLLDAYTKIFPGKEVRPVIFAYPSPWVELDEANAYVAEGARKNGLWSLLATRPGWSAEELARQVEEGGFLGLKPYPWFAEGLSEEEVTIFDYLPPAHLEVADEKGWLVMLHIPRPGRLADPVNLEQIRQICTRYPHVRLILAHVGRAYCPRGAKEGLAALRDLNGLHYDISANSNQEVFEMLIREVGPRRILYGSDLPIAAMRAKRICEGDEYVNYVRHADWEDKRTRRNPEEEDTYTFFIYEEVLAFRQAAEALELGEREVEDVFYNNAWRLLRG